MGQTELEDSEDTASIIPKGADLRRAEETDPGGCGILYGLPVWRTTEKNGRRECFRLCPPGQRLGGHSQPAGNTGLRLGQTLSHGAIAGDLANRAEVVRGCRMGPCSCLLTEQGQLCIQAAVSPGRSLLGDISPPEHLYLLLTEEIAGGAVPQQGSKKWGSLCPGPAWALRRSSRQLGYPCPLQEHTWVHCLPGRKRSAVGWGRVG